MKPVALFFCVLSISAIFVARADDDDDDESGDVAEAAISFTQESFKEQIGGDKAYFIKFFAPWCGHCKRLAPTWNDLAKKYKSLEYDDQKTVVIAKVDCTVETSLCSDQDVTGYPTLKFFAPGSDSSVKFRGQRDLDSLAQFVEEQMGRAPDSKPDSKDKEVDQDEQVVVDNGLHVLTGNTLAKVLSSGSDVFVKFYAPWCGHCQKLAPTWDQLASAFEKDDKVKIAKLDCTQAQSVCQEYEVRGYPTLQYFRNGKLAENYRGARSLSELTDFVKSMLEAKDAKKPEAAEDSKAEESHVLKVDKDNFEETIKQGLTFVKFFAPWCGHCKRLAPTWQQLAKFYATEESVKIAHVDCTSDDNQNKELCNNQGVSGFPTLNLYKDGSKVTEYSDKRDLEALKSFVAKHQAQEATTDEAAVPAKEEL